MISKIIFLIAFVMWVAATTLPVATFVIKNYPTMGTWCEGYVILGIILVIAAAIHFSNYPSLAGFVKKAIDREREIIIIKCKDCGATGAVVEYKTAHCGRCGSSNVEKVDIRKEETRSFGLMIQ